MSTDPEKFAYNVTGAETARPDAGDDLTGMPTADQSATDTRGGMNTGVPTLSANDLEFHGEIGRGGMGVVHLARHKRVRGRWYAVKMPDPERASPASAVRFRREMAALLHVRHPHVITLCATSREGAAPLMALEYIEGPEPADPTRHPAWKSEWPNPPLTLADLLARGRLSTRRVADLGVKLAAALAAVHTAGLIHRDVKPANVLINKDNDPILTDFGLTRDYDPEVLRLTGSMDNLGTILYCAPEMRSDPAAAGPAADQYSLALTLLAAATGADPDGSLTRGIDQRLERVIDRARDRDVESRFPTMAEFRDALMRLRPSRDGYDPTTVTCPDCGGENRDTDPRCGHCGHELFGPCLKCGAATPFSRPACLKCGAVQRDVLHALEDDATARHATAAAARRAMRYAEAVAALEPIAEYSHPQTLPLVERAEAELEAVRTEWEGWQRRAAEAGAAAWPDYAAGRYANLESYFRDIPAAMWTRRLRLFSAAARRLPSAQTRTTALLRATLAKHAPSRAVVEPESAAASTDLRHLFKRYLESVRHHTQHELSQTILFVNAEVFRVRFFALTSLYETREVEVQTTPHKGEPDTPPEFAPGDTDAWGCSFPPSPTVADGATAHPVPESRRVIACGGCADGTVACGTCHGRALTKCPDCHGKKKVKCYTCSGDRRVAEKRSVERFRDCRSCRGVGCGSCDRGRERYVDNETVYIDCARCRASGFLPCQKCEEEGEVPCGACDKGRLRCSACAGTCRVVEVAVVRRTFRVGRRQTEWAHPPGMPEDVFARFREDRDFVTVETVDSTAEMPFGQAPDGGSATRLDGQLRDLLAGAAPSAAGERLARQQIEVRTATAYQFTYWNGQKEYECWVIGSARELFAPLNPVTDELERMVLDAASEEEPRVAALMARDAREMAADDPACEAALARTRQNLPDSVWKWSETVWTVRKLNTVITGASITGAGLLFLLIGFAVSLGLSAFGAIAALVGGGVLWYGWSMPR